MNHPGANSNQSLADAVDNLARSVISAGSYRRGNAAATMWRPGLAVTSAAAIDRTNTLRLTLPNGESVEGEVHGADRATDMAIIALPDAASSADLIVPARSEIPARVGDFVFAVGRDPSGMVQASFGHIGAVGGAWRAWSGAAFESLVRLDGGLYPGFQGAPVADAQGRILGIASGSFSRHHGIVLTCATVDRLVTVLLEHGRVPRAHLGVAVHPVELPAAGKQAAVTTATSALLVTHIAPDGPAAKAGIMVGDLMVNGNDLNLTDVQALHAMLAAGTPGQSVPFRLLRGGAVVDLAVELGEPAASSSRCGS